MKKKISFFTLNNRASFHAFPSVAITIRTKSRTKGYIRHLHRERVVLNVQVGQFSLSMMIQIADLFSVDYGSDIAIKKNLNKNKSPACVWDIAV